MTLYKRKNFKIYGTVSSDEGYLIVNENKEFEQGHSHINNYKLAKHIIDLAINHKIPRNDKTFIIDSLIRISSDKDYVRRLSQVKNPSKRK